jgi:chemotaxis protein CheX
MDWELSTDSKVVQPFIDAIIKVMQTMVGITPTVGDIQLWNNEHAAGEVVGIVGLANEQENVKGFMSIGFSEASLLQIVSGMLGETFTEITTEVREAVGEIANIVSGQARLGLSAMGLKLQAALPSVISGQQLVLEWESTRVLLMVQFKIESGTFELGLCLGK